MWQEKYTSGNEIQVLGKGENGLSRVVNSLGRIEFEGGYKDCVAWLKSRACRPINQPRDDEANPGA
jgi:hypothetical protein